MSAQFHISLRIGFLLMTDGIDMRNEKQEKMACLPLQKKTKTKQQKENGDRIGINFMATRRM